MLTKVVSYRLNGKTVSRKEYLKATAKQGSGYASLSEEGKKRFESSTGNKKPIGVKTIVNPGTPTSPERAEMLRKQQLASVERDLQRLRSGQNVSKSLSELMSQRQFLASKNESSKNENIITIGGFSLSESQIKQGAYKNIPASPEVIKAFKDYSSMGEASFRINKVKNLMSDYQLKKQKDKEDKIQRILSSIPKNVQDTTKKLWLTETRWNREKQKRFDFFKKNLDTASRLTIGRNSGKVGDFASTMLTYADPILFGRELGLGISKAIWLKRLKNNYPVLKDNINKQFRSAEQEAVIQVTNAYKDPTTYVLPLLPAFFKVIKKSSTSKNINTSKISSIASQIASKSKKTPKSILIRLTRKLIREEFKASKIGEGLDLASKKVNSLIKEAKIKKSIFKEALKLEKASLKIKVKRTISKKTPTLKPKTKKITTPKVIRRAKLSGKISKESVKIRIQRAKTYIQNEIKTINDALTRDKKVISEVVKNFKIKISKARRLFFERFKKVLDKNKRSLTKEQEIKIIKKMQSLKSSFIDKAYKQRADNFLKSFKKSPKNKYSKSLSKNKELFLRKRALKIQKAFINKKLAQERTFYNNWAERFLKDYYASKKQKSLSKSGERRILARINKSKKKILNEYNKKISKERSKDIKRILKDITPSAKFTMKKYFSDLKRSLIFKMQKRLKTLEAKKASPSKNKFFKIKKPLREIDTVFRGRKYRFDYDLKSGKGRVREQIDSGYRYVRSTTRETTEKILNVKSRKTSRKRFNEYLKKSGSTASKKIDIKFFKNGNKFQVIRRSDGSGTIYQYVETEITSGNKVLKRVQKVKLEEIKPSIQRTSVGYKFARAKSRKGLLSITIGAIGGSAVSRKIKRNNMGVKSKVKSKSSTSRIIGRKNLRKRSSISKRKTRSRSKSKSKSDVKKIIDIKDKSAIDLKRSIALKKSQMQDLSQSNIYKESSFKKSKKIKIPKIKIKNIKSNLQGYQVSIKTPTGWKRVNKYFIKKEADLLGRFLTDKSIRASYKVIKTSKKVNSKLIGLKTSASKFRKSKSRTGSNKNIVVEKRGKRLDTPTEVNQITASRILKTSGLRFQFSKKPKKSKSGIKKRYSKRK